MIKYKVVKNHIKNLIYKNGMEKEILIKACLNILNLTLCDYLPMNEFGENTDKDFDKRFPIDRTFHYQKYNFKKRIRFVTYPYYEKVSISFMKMKVSEILINRLSEKSCYVKNEDFEIPFSDIEKELRRQKLNRISQKIII